MILINIVEKRVKENPYEDHVDVCIFLPEFDSNGRKTPINIFYTERGGVIRKNKKNSSNCFHLRHKFFFFDSFSDRYKVENNVFGLPSIR